MLLSLVGNHICIELSEPEAYAIAQNQNIQALLPLYPRMEENLRYTLSVHKGILEPELAFVKNELIVKMPIGMIKSWVMNDEKELESKIHNALGEDFTIILKKEF